MDICFSGVRTVQSYAPINFQMQHKQVGSSVQFQAMLLIFTAINLYSKPGHISIHLSVSFLDGGLLQEM